MTRDPAAKADADTKSADPGLDVDPEASALTAPPPAPRQSERDDMVDHQLRTRDITDPRVLEVMRRVPRHAFVPDAAQAVAYRDGPLSIGHDVTISQPYIVALMTQLAQIDAGARVLDVGTGSGYQAAVLSALGAQVFGVEIIEPLAEAATERLARLGYPATIAVGDGYRGCPEHAPFDAILLAAAPHAVPPALVEQLAVGGRLVLPVGERGCQELVVITKTARGTQRERVIRVVFVPMTGEALDGPG